MLDYKVYTFLKLCELMNYRKTAYHLNMTQPAVTQHIKALETEYDCKLFDYNNKVLKKTTAGSIFESYAKSAAYNEKAVRQKLLSKQKSILRIGATKTIGDYVIYDKIEQLIIREDIEVSLIVDNTTNLLNMVDKGLLDIAIIEGFFDKSKYDYILFKKESFVGMCSNMHAFANKSIPLEEIFNEHLVVRELGSGTRAIFEQVLKDYNYSLDTFKSISSISSFEMMKRLVANNNLISFTYESVVDSRDDISKFFIENLSISREFNFVLLKDTETKNYISLLNKY